MCVRDLNGVCPMKPYFVAGKTSVQGYTTFFMLSSRVLEISIAHNNQIAKKSKLYLLSISQMLYLA